MTNGELFKLYDSDIVLRLHNAKNLSDTRKILARFKENLGQYPPSLELAKSFLAKFVDRKPRTLSRYAQMLGYRGFESRLPLHSFLSFSVAWADFHSFIHIDAILPHAPTL